MLGMRHSATARRTSTIIIDEVRDQIDKKPKELMATLSREYGVKLTYKQAYRAKEKALEEIQGSPSQSYMMIPWICERLKETDNGTVAEYKATPDNTFECVFIAYGCCIHGFLEGARLVLYIDGTHLSGYIRELCSRLLGMMQTLSCFPLQLSLSQQRQMRIRPDFGEDKEDSW